MAQTITIPAGTELRIVVAAAPLASEPADRLIPIARGPLAELGLEIKPVLRLIAAGALKVVEIGRRRFTKLSYLVALVDELPAATSTPEPEDDDLTAATRAAARRRAAP